MAAASGDRPIQNVLGNPNDFNDLYRPPSVKVVVFYNRERQNSNTGAILILRIGSAASTPIASHERNLERLLGMSSIDVQAIFRCRHQPVVMSRFPPAANHPPRAARPGQRRAGGVHLPRR